MQLLDYHGHPDGKMPKHCAGDLYDLFACSEETFKNFNSSFKHCS
jgi:hypothetical protein